jgi:hypothetical protein
MITLSHAVYLPDPACVAAGRTLCPSSVDDARFLGVTAADMSLQQISQLPVLVGMQGMEGRQAHLFDSATRQVVSSPQIQPGRVMFMDEITIPGVGNFSNKLLVQIEAAKSGTTVEGQGSRSKEGARSKGGARGALIAWSWAVRGKFTLVVVTPVAAINRPVDDQQASINASSNKILTQVILVAVATMVILALVLAGQATAIMSPLNAVERLVEQAKNLSWDDDLDKKKLEKKLSFSIRRKKMLSVNRLGVVAEAKSAPVELSDSKDSKGAENLNEIAKLESECCSLLKALHMQRKHGCTAQQANPFYIEQLDQRLLDLDVAVGAGRSGGAGVEGAAQKGAGAGAEAEARAAEAEAEAAACLERFGGEVTGAASFRKFSLQQPFSVSDAVAGLSESAAGSFCSRMGMRNRLILAIILPSLALYLIVLAIMSFQLSTNSDEWIAPVTLALVGQGVDDLDIRSIVLHSAVVGMFQRASQSINIYRKSVEDVWNAGHGLPSPLTGQLLAPYPLFYSPRGVVPAALNGTMLGALPPGGVPRDPRFPDADWLNASFQASNFYANGNSGYAQQDGYEPPFAGANWSDVVDIQSKMSHADNAARTIYSSNEQLQALYFADEKHETFRQFPHRDFGGSYSTWSGACMALAGKPKRIGYTPVCRPWYVGAKKNPFTDFWTDLYVDAVGKAVLISVARAVNDANGKFVGVVSADYSVDGLNDVIQRVQLGSGKSNNGYAYIVDNGGVPFLHPRVDLSEPSKRTLVELELGCENGRGSDSERSSFEKTTMVEILNATSQGRSSYMRCGEIWYMSFNPISLGSSDYVLVLTVPQSDITAQSEKLQKVQREHMKTYLTSLIMVVYVIAVVIGMISERVSGNYGQSVNQLTRFLHVLHSGDKDSKFINDFPAELEIQTALLEEIADNTCDLVVALRFANPPLACKAPQLRSRSQALELYHSRGQRAGRHRPEAGQLMAEEAAARAADEAACWSCNVCFCTNGRSVVSCVDCQAVEQSKQEAEQVAKPKQLFKDARSYSARFFPTAGSSEDETLLSSIAQGRAKHHLLRNNNEVSSWYDRYLATKKDKPLQRLKYKYLHSQLRSVGDSALPVKDKRRVKELAQELSLSDKDKHNVKKQLALEQSGALHSPEMERLADDLGQRYMNVVLAELGSGDKQHMEDVFTRVLGIHTTTGNSVLLIRYAYALAVAVQQGSIHCDPRSRTEERPFGAIRSWMATFAREGLATLKEAWEDADTLRKAWEEADKLQKEKLAEAWGADALTEAKVELGQASVSMACFALSIACHQPVWCRLALSVLPKLSLFTLCRVAQQAAAGGSAQLRKEIAEKMMGERFKGCVEWVPALGGAAAPTFEVLEGTYDVLFEDGHRDTAVAGSSIKSGGGGGVGAYKAGDKVEAQLEGKGEHFPGKVQKVNALCEAL